MEIKEYTEAVAKLISEQNENFIVEANDVQKNNGLMLNGITIYTEGCMISPVIYTNAMYEHDLTVEEAAEKIMEIYEEHKDGMKDFDVNAIQQFDSVKDKIIARVINKDRNTSIMNTCPYAQFGDLIVTFHVLVQQNESGTASAKITNEMMNTWKVNLDQLIEVAYENTKKVLPIEILPMETILREMMERAGGITPDMEEALSMPDHLMFVVSNSGRQYGAYYLTDREGLLKIASEIKEDKYFILPSSVHEFIVVPASQAENAESLVAMVKEVNATQVSPDEVLADNVYSFDAQTEELRAMDGTIIPFIA